VQREPGDCLVPADAEDEADAPAVIAEPQQLVEWRSDGKFILETNSGRTSPIFRSR
jgi:hypothetical protein